jgi:hypothetical protein
MNVSLFFVANESISMALKISISFQSYFNFNFIQVVNGPDIAVIIAVAADQIKVIT